MNKVHHWDGYYAVGYDPDLRPILRLTGGQLTGPDPVRRFWELYYEITLKQRPYPETVLIDGKPLQG